MSSSPRACYTCPRCDATHSNSNRVEGEATDGNSCHSPQPCTAFAGLHRGYHAHKSPPCSPEGRVSDGDSCCHTPLAACAVHAGLQRSHTTHTTPCAPSKTDGNSCHSPPPCAACCWAAQGAPSARLDPRWPRVTERAHSLCCQKGCRQR